MVRRYAIVRATAPISGKPTGAWKIIVDGKRLPYTYKSWENARIVLRSYLAVRVYVEPTYPPRPCDVPGYWALSPQDRDAMWPVYQAEVVRRYGEAMDAAHAEADRIIAQAA